MAPEDELLPQTAPSPNTAQTPEHAEFTPAPEATQALVPGSAETAISAPPRRNMRWVFIGGQGLRAGWSVLLFLIFFFAFNIGLDAVLLRTHMVRKGGDFTPAQGFFSEGAGFIALLLSLALIGLIERRSILAYNLTGPRRPQRFVSGLATGFAVLSALIGSLAAGGWLHFGPAAHGLAVVWSGLLWGCVFLMVGCVEEGMMRCYLLFTLTRGINFWWALGVVALLCGVLAFRFHGFHAGAAWGVYGIALLGVFPCLALQHNHAASSGFWCAAWATSTLFGFVHVDNSGEAWIGIFAAAAIGFVFCVSVRLTGSAWWAIGCHAGWDWGETYFYGTADSGLTAHGSFLTSSPSGNPLWSGGSVGPEGSLLVLAVILLLLIYLLIAYGRRKLPAYQPAVPGEAAS